MPSHDEVLATIDEQITGERDAGQSNSPASPIIFPTISRWPSAFRRMPGRPAVGSRRIAASQKRAPGSIAGSGEW